MSSETQQGWNQFTGTQRWHTDPLGAASAAPFGSPCWGGRQNPPRHTLIKPRWGRQRWMEIGRQRWRNNLEPHSSTAKNERNTQTANSNTISIRNARLAWFSQILENKGLYALKPKIGCCVSCTCILWRTCSRRSRDGIRSVGDSCRESCWWSTESIRLRTVTGINGRGGIRSLCRPSHSLE